MKNNRIVEVDISILYNIIVIKRWNGKHRYSYSRKNELMLLKFLEFRGHVVEFKVYSVV